LVLELSGNFFIECLFFYVGKAVNFVVGILQDFDEFFALCASDFVCGFFQSRAGGAGIEYDDSEVGGAGAEGDITYRALFRVVMGSHILFCEEYHNLVELAARGADVIVFDGLCHVDDL